MSHENKLSSGLVFVNNTNVFQTGSLLPADIIRVVYLQMPVFNLHEYSRETNVHKDNHSILHSNKYFHVFSFPHTSDDCCSNQIHLFIHLTPEAMFVPSVTDVTPCGTQVTDPSSDSQQVSKHVSR